VKPAVFLDRDGTMIEDVGYLDAFDRIEFFPWTVDAIRSLNRAGFAVVVVTNQAGVARGFFDETFVQETHRRIDARLAAGGARVDAYYYCPHHPDGRVAEFVQRCDCRKPGPGMIHQAARDLSLDPARSFVVGDTWLDIGLSRAAGSRGILVRTGAGAAWEARPQAGLAADAVVDKLAAAASWILRNSQLASRNSAT
jgi:D-glycero-D-manno-heptose 1,7-bisphosphate phosphatase